MSITTRDFENITVELLLTLAVRPRPLSDVDRHSLDSAEAWLKRNTDGKRREAPPLDEVLVISDLPNGEPRPCRGS